MKNLAPFSQAIWGEAFYMEYSFFLERKRVLFFVANGVAIFV